MYAAQLRGFSRKIQLFSFSGLERENGRRRARDQRHPTDLPSFSRLSIVRDLGSVDLFRVLQSNNRRICVLSNGTERLLWRLARRSKRSDVRRLSFVSGTVRDTARRKNNFIRPRRYFVQSPSFDRRRSRVRRFISMVLRVSYTRNSSDDPSAMCDAAE